MLVRVVTSIECDKTKIEQKCRKNQNHEKSREQNSTTKKLMPERTLSD
jgi:hypothetical protein